MKRFLQTFEVELTVKGPVFIGSGQELTKKEYIYNRKQQKIVILKSEKMYADLKHMQKAAEYEEFMSPQSKINNLARWIKEHKIPPQYIDEWKSYELNYRSDRVMPLKYFMKDAYGLPYVPGSSLKGMLRTILLAYDIEKNPRRYEGIKEKIKSEIKNSEERNQNPKGKNKKERKDRQYLSELTEQLETTAFSKLNPAGEAIDVMSGIIVSDSAPLALNDLMLNQKSGVPFKIDKDDKKLPLLCECLKPGTKVKFSLTVDSRLCPYTKDYIMDAVNWFAGNVYDNFINKYPGMNKPLPKNSVWLGGGAGYVSKTVTYQLFGKEAPYVVNTIFRNTGVPINHKHNEYVKLGMVPHILKMTKRDNVDSQFGLCTIKITEV